MPTHNIYKPSFSLGFYGLQKVENWWLVAAV